MIIALLLGCPAVTDHTVPCDVCGGACDAAEQDFGSARHITHPIDYADTPPYGGDHNPCWAAWGVHTEPVDDDNWVHNLEHGGVVFLYNCPEGCDEDATAIADLATSLGPYALVTPYSDMTRKFAVISWGHRLEMDCRDDDVLRQFYIDHQDNAPESSISDPGSGCM
jgi:hypothetical protein